MKHASEKTLNIISGLLMKIRTLPGLKEQKTGIFYRKSKAFLHFHEDPKGIFADLRLNSPEFERYNVTTLECQTHFFNELSQGLN